MRCFQGLVGLMVFGSLVGLGAGCTTEEDVDSSDIRTHGMYADFIAIAKGDGDTIVTAQLRVGGDDGTIVKLVSGDSLVGSVGEEERTLSPIDDRERYRATFGTDEGGTAVRVSFERDGDDDAPDSSVELPEPFELSVEEDAFQRGEDVLIAVSSEGAGELSWELDGDCVMIDSGEAADDGTLTLSSDDVEVSPLGEGETCEVTVTVQREARGSLDPAFGEGGRIRGIQERTISFTSTPAPSETPEDGGDEPEGEGGESGDEGAAGSAGSENEPAEGGAGGAAGGAGGEAG